jgi:hypothetical protein
MCVSLSTLFQSLTPNSMLPIYTSRFPDPSNEVVIYPSQRLHISLAQHIYRKIMQPKISVIYPIQDSFPSLYCVRRILSSRGPRKVRSVLAVRETSTASRAAAAAAGDGHKAIDSEGDDGEDDEEKDDDDGDDIVFLHLGGLESGRACVCCRTERGLLVR